MATITVSSGPSAGETISLDGDVVVGREGADLTISDPELSRRHVAFRLRDGVVVVEDLGSTNGTMVDGERINEPTTLIRNATVKIGQTELAVALDAGVTVMRSSPTTLRSTPPAPSASPPADAERPPGDARVGVPGGGPPPGPPAGAPPAAASAGGPPGGPPPSGASGGPPGGRPGGAPGGPPPGVAAKERAAAKGGIPEFIPWLIAAVAVAVAVIVAATSGSSSKKAPTKPPPAVKISVLGSGTMQPLTGNRTLPNGAKLTLDTSGEVGVQVQQLTLQPGASEPWHTHPGSGLAIVQSGVVDDYEQVGTGCKLFALGPQHVRFDVGNSPHSLVNNGKVPAVVVVTGFAPPGKTAALIPAHKPPNCHE